MAKKYLNFKFSEFTTNKNFNFSRKKILKVLPEKHLLDANKVISKWKGYKKTPLINLRILSKKLRTNNIFYCLLYTSPSPRDATLSRMPSSA